MIINIFFSIKINLFIGENNVKAIWNNEIIAQSNRTVSLEGNEYFPLDSLNMKFFLKSDKTSICPWKGQANYFDVVVNGEKNLGAAWIYHNPSSAAQEIKNHVAFWRGVKVET